MRNFFISFLILSATLTAPLHAQTTGEIVDELTQEDIALEAASQAAISGPREIVLRDQAILQIKPGSKFIPRKQANDLLLAWGNTASEQLVGVILPSNEEETWTLLIEQTTDGYVSDAEAKNWNPDELLETIKLGAVADNKDRIARGFPEVEVMGWKQAPTYDPTLHRLTWGLQSRDKGAPQGEEVSINYNTYQLGRDGYFKFNLVTSPESFDHDEAIGQHIVDRFAYIQGKRYQDFQVQSDKPAAYSIATLVSGSATSQTAGKAQTNANFWDFMASYSRYFAIACALAAVMVYFTGRKK